MLLPEVPLAKPFRAWPDQFSINGITEYLYIAEQALFTVSLSRGKSELLQEPRISCLCHLLPVCVNISGQLQILYVRFLT